MYIQTWSKYLPIIKILLKRAIASDQLFNLNASDFQQAGATRKTGYKFLIHFCDGRLDNVLTCNLAKDFTIALAEEAGTKFLLTQQDYSISMDKNFRLTIKCIPKAAVEQERLQEELVAV